MKKLLLLAYKYPPYSGVGAFRWANLSYEFAQAGMKVHVVTVKWKRKSNSSFLHVLNHPNIIVHQLPSLGFHNLRYIEGKGKITSFLAKLIRWAIRRFLRPWYWLDEAQQWHWVMVPYVKKVLRREKISTIIATGAPFSVNYAAARIKQKLSKRNIQLKLIQDMRDLWNDLPNYSFTFGSQRRCKKSIIYEAFSYDVADHVVTVTKGLAQTFQQKTKTPVKVIYNGFPGEPTTKMVDGVGSNVKNIVYAGGFAHGRDDVLLVFLQRLKQANLLNKIFITIYSSWNIQDMLKKQQVFTSNLEFRNPVPYEQLLVSIPNFDFGLHLNGLASKDALSTKIFDYISVGIPVLSVNYGDEIHSFIQENEFGLSFSLNDFPNDELLFDQLFKTYSLNDSTVLRFSYSQIASQYLNIIK